MGETSWSRADDILDRAARIAPELRDWLMGEAEKQLYFWDISLYGAWGDPDNRAYFWMLRSYAEDPRVDISFWVDAVRYVRERWRIRCRGYRPYKDMGYLFYIYETTAPKLDIVQYLEARDAWPGTNEIVVPSIRDFCMPYAERPSLGVEFARMEAEPEPSDGAILEAVDAHHGSISKPTARALGISVAELRRTIERHRLADAVNALRKRYRRRPARFVDVDMDAPCERIYREIWRPNYAD